MTAISQGLAVQQIPISASADDGDQATGVITYTDHPTGGIDVTRAFFIGEITYSFGGAAVPFETDKDDYWTAMVAAINSSTSRWSAAINTTLGQVTITYSTKGIRGNSVVFANSTVENASFTGGGYLSGGTDSVAFPYEDSYDMSIDGRYVSVDIYEAISSKFIKVKEDDPRIGDIKTYDPSDTSPTLRITFNSDFSGTAVVIGGTGSTYDLNERLDDLEEAVNTLINAANNKFARTTAVDMAVSLITQQLTSIQSSIQTIEDKLQKLFRVTNTNINIR